MTTPIISVLPLELRFRTEGLLKFPPFPGSLWRGAFGIELKKLSCPNLPMCSGACPYPERCAYGFIFETPLLKENGRLGNVKQAPRPYSIYPVTQGPALLEPGSELFVRFTLWGTAYEFLPYLILAWRNCGIHGLGFQRVPATLLDVCRVDTGKEIYSEKSGKIRWDEATPLTLQDGQEPCRVSLQTMTPLRIKHNNRLLGLKRDNDIELTGTIFFRTLLRRVETCANLESAKETLKPLYKRIAETENATSKMEWQEITRYSNRQKTKMQIGGLVGTIEWNDLPAIWISLLQIGEWIQIGKDTTMGLGKYKLAVSDID